MKIMIVDDHGPSLAAMGQLVSLLGGDCREYVSPLSALSAFKEDRGGFDVVFTDYSMNEMNGVEFAMEIITLHPLQRVVLMTGGQLSEGHRRLMDTLRVGVLAKPLDPSELLSVLQSDG